MIVERKTSILKTFRYNLLSSARQMVLRTEAARRQLETDYRKANELNKPKGISPFLSGFLSAFFLILVGFVLFKGSIFLYQIATPPLQDVYKFITGIGDVFGLLYEAINIVLHIVGELIGNIIHWASSIHLTENSDRIVIPNPFYDP